MCSGQWFLFLDLIFVHGSAFLSTGTLYSYIISVWNQSNILWSFWYFNCFWSVCAPFSRLSLTPLLDSQGFTYPVRSHFLENILETIGYRLTPYNQIDNYGQDKMWKMQKQALRKRKTQIASAVEVSFWGYCLLVMLFVLDCHILNVKLATGCSWRCRL